MSSNSYSLEKVGPETNGSVKGETDGSYVTHIGDGEAGNDNDVTEKKDAPQKTVGLIEVVSI